MAQLNQSKTIIKKVHSNNKINSQTKNSLTLGDSSTSKTFDGRSFKEIIATHRSRGLLSPSPGEEIVSTVTIFEELADLQIFKIQNLRVPVVKASEVLKMLGYNSNYISKKMKSFFDKFNDDELIKRHYQGGHQNYFFTEFGIYRTIYKVVDGPKNQHVDEDRLERANQLKSKLSEILYIVRRTNPNLFYGVLFDQPELLSKEELTEYKQLKHEKDILVNNNRELQKHNEELIEVVDQFQDVFVYCEDQIQEKDRRIHKLKAEKSDIHLKLTLACRDRVPKPKNINNCEILIVMRRPSKVVESYVIYEFIKTKKTNSKNRIKAYLKIFSDAEMIKVIDTPNANNLLTRIKERYNKLELYLKFKYNKIEFDTDDLPEEDLIE